MPNPSHLYASQIVGWASADTDQAAVDTTLRRDSAGVVGTPGDLTVVGTLTAGVLAASGATNITVSSATAFTVARTGTNYAFQVSTNTASSATGIQITAAAAGGGIAFAAISSGSNENLTIDAKGSGTITLGGTSTGNVGVGAVPSYTLHVTKNQNASTYLTTTNTTDGTSTVAGMLIEAAGTRFGYVYHTSPSFTAIANYADRVVIASSGNTASGILYDATTLGHEWRINNVNKMTLDATGLSLGSAVWLKGDPGNKRVLVDDTNNTTTMEDIADLSVTVEAAGVYTGELVIFAANSTAADGLKFDFDGGTATMTSFDAGSLPAHGATAGTVYADSKDDDFTWTTVSVNRATYVIKVGFVVNGAGTIIPRYAMVAATTGTATIEANSYFKISRTLN